MNTFKKLNFIISLFCGLLLTASCDKIEDLTEKEFKVDDFEIEVPNEVTEDPDGDDRGGDSEVPVLRIFSGTEPVYRDSVLGKYKNQYQKIKSITLEKATITIIAEGSNNNNNIIKEFTINCKENSKSYEIKEDYKIGETHSSPEMDKYATSILNELVKHESLHMEYKGKTDLPAGTKIIHKIAFTGVKIKGNVLDI